MRLYPVSAVTVCDHNICSLALTSKVVNLNLYDWTAERARAFIELGGNEVSETDPSRLGRMLRPIMSGTRLQ